MAECVLGKEGGNACKFLELKIIKFCRKSNGISERKHPSDVRFHKMSMSSHIPPLSSVTYMRR